MASVIEIDLLSISFNRFKAWHNHSMLKNSKLRTRINKFTYFRCVISICCTPNPTARLSSEVPVERNSKYTRTKEAINLDMSKLTLPSKSIDISTPKTVLLRLPLTSSRMRTPKL